MQTAVGIEITSQVRQVKANNHTKVPKMLQCLFSRVACVSCLVVITFLICLTQEFTYMLNYHSYATTDTWEELQPSANKYPSKKTWRVSPNTLTTSNSVDKRRHVSAKAIDEADYWRKITEDIYAYSAYWDNRSGNKSFVRIIAGVKVPTINLNSLKCLLTNDNSFEMYDDAITTYDFLIEDHNKSSKAAFIMCSTQNDVPPSFVALVPHEWNKTSISQPFWFNVHRLNKNETHFEIGVCVRPMFNYTDIFRIVEFVAYYEALGANHFIFYDYDTLPEASRIIRYLQASNYSVDWYPWNIPSDLNDMWALGQVANINDCIYRYMGTASYIAVVDLDEFITPRHAMTIPELMSAHDVAWKKLGSFVMRSCVFCLEYEQDGLQDSIPNFVTQTRIRRENKVWPFHHRSKYIAIPDRVVSAGIHYVREHMPEVSECLVKPSQVLVHHYRAKLCGHEGKDLQIGEVDPISRKYLNNLFRSKALEAWKESKRSKNTSYAKNRVDK